MNSNFLCEELKEERKFNQLSFSHQRYNVNRHFEENSCYDPLSFCKYVHGGLVEGSTFRALSYHKRGEENFSHQYGGQIESEGMHIIDEQDFLNQESLELQISRIFANYYCGFNKND